MMFLPFKKPRIRKLAFWLIALVIIWVNVLNMATNVNPFGPAILTFPILSTVIQIIYAEIGYIVIRLIIANVVEVPNRDVHVDFLMTPLGKHTFKIEACPACDSNLVLDTKAKEQNVGFCLKCEKVFELENDKLVELIN